MNLVSLPERFNVARFWEKVDRQGINECWEWQAYRNADGYGHLGKVSDDLGTQLAHRISWCIHLGEIPLGWMVLHRCDNPPCVNPIHLFLGNGKLNMLDCVSKGRLGDNSDLVSGERNGMAKLTEDDVREMRRLHLEQGLSGYRLAKKFGVHKQHAYDILARRYWAHI